MKSNNNTAKTLIPKTNIFILGTFCLLPTIFTFISFHMEYYPQLVYPISKIILIAIPIVIWKSSGLSKKDLLKTIGLKRSNCFYGLITGIIIALLIVASYYLLFRKLIDPQPFYKKISSLEIVKYFWAMAIFISLWNSFIEEYYWRAFILERFTGYFRNIVLLAILNGCLFGLHHFVILKSYVPWQLALFFTIGTAIGGSFWAWLRLRGVSLVDCYISHICADLAVMWIGWDMISKMS